jgi:SAM-dependent methyltransferase
MPATSHDPEESHPDVLRPDVLRGLIEIRHVRGGTRAAYDQIFAGAGMSLPMPVWDTVLDLLDVAPGMRLLDVACGEGELLGCARQRGLEAHGIDLSEVALRKARTHGGHVAVVNGEALPYPDGTFDRVVNFGSLEHYDDPVAGAREMARVLTAGGRALFQLPNAFGLRWNVMHVWRTGDVHDDGQPIQRYGTRAQWTAVLATGGFTVTDVLPYEDARVAPGRGRDWLGTLRHPSRLLVPLAGRLPIDMASMFLFLASKAPSR